MKLLILIGILSLIVLTVQEDSDEYKNFGLAEAPGDDQFDSIDSIETLDKRMEKIDTNRAEINPSLQTLPR